MSLPADEHRVLNQMEGALRASEPRLAAMYAIFARLNAAEPVGAESLACGRLPRPRTAVCAMVLIPVMFAVIVTGALLTGSARGATGCLVGQSAIRGGPMLSRTSCPAPRKGAEAKPPGTAFSPGSMLERDQDHTSRGVPCRSSSSGMRPRSC
jgi:hypothetical protein